MAEVRVLFDGWEGSGDRPAVTPVTVEGEDSAAFLDALRRAVGWSFHGALLVILNDPETDPEFEWRSFAFIDEETTLGGVSQFADGEPVSVSVQAVGGSIFMTLLEWVGAGLTFREIAGWSLARIEAHVFARRRASARRWLLGGAMEELPMDLLQHVRAEKEWHLSYARTVFGLGDGDLGRLFRAANYAYAPENSWVELSPE